MNRLTTKTKPMMKTAKPSTHNKVSQQALELTASRLAELGHPTRLAIFKHLVKFGRKGCPVGDIQQALNIPGSTLSHHLAKMIQVGLVTQVRESRSLFCYPSFDALAEVLAYLHDECCVNEC